MQSDRKVDLKNDATTSTNKTSDSDTWVKDFENLESLFTDKNKFTAENLKDNQQLNLTSNEIAKGCLSPSNLLNDCTNKSTDNSNERLGEKLNDHLKDKSISTNFLDHLSNYSNKSRKRSNSSESEKDEEEDDEEKENDEEDEEEEEESLNGTDNDADEETGDEIDRTDNKSKKNTKKRKKTFQRRNIKKLIQEKDLNESVLTARKEEQERINRILEQQKQLKTEQQFQKATTSKSVADDIVLSSDDDVELIESSGEEESDIIQVYERIQDELDAANSGLHTDDTLNTLTREGRCLINIGHPSDDPDIYLDDYLAKKVKPHQIGGIRFLYDCIVENLSKVKKTDGIGGCILAHSMGLGKTLQVVSFTELYLRVTNQKHILCIVPVNTIQNWMSEYDQWLPNEKNLAKLKDKIENKPSTSRKKDDHEEDEAKFDEHLHLRKPRNFNVYSLSDLKTFMKRSQEIEKWRETGGVLLMGYEMYRLLFAEDECNKKKKDKNKKDKNKKDKNKKKNAKNKNKRPSCLDGLTVQEYYDRLEEIKSSLIDPGPDLVICDEGHRIKNCKSSISKSLNEIRTRRRIILTGYPLQNNLTEYWCMVNFVRPGFLGTRAEFVNMFERPIQNGQCFDSNDEDRILAKKRAHVLHKLLIGFVQRRSFTILFNSLPRKQEFCLYIRMTDLQRGLLLAFFRHLQSLHFIKPFANNPLYIYSVCYKIWNHTDVLHRKMFEDYTDEDSDEDINPGSPKKRLKSLSADYNEDNEFNYDWANNLMENYETKNLNNSLKMVVLFRIIDETIKLGERILIFSQSLNSLDVIEDFLCQREVPNDKNKTKFIRHVNYLRLDGSTCALDRKNYIDQFNKNTKYHLFLISTKAGCLGINLTGANRLIVLDISFNPCHDAQAVHRIFRYGQKKECFVYRFIFDNSLEKRIFDRQISKQSMSNQVVDEINSDANLTQNEITSMVDGLEAMEDPPIPKFSEDELNQYNDPIMRVICKELNYCLTKKPLPHESLLAESEATKLTRWEKQAAEHEYNRDLFHIKMSKAKARNWEALHLQEQSNQFNRQTIQQQPANGNNLNQQNANIYQPQIYNQQNLPNQNFNNVFYNGPVGPSFGQPQVQGVRPIQQNLQQQLYRPFLQPQQQMLQQRPQFPMQQPIIQNPSYLLQNPSQINYNNTNSLNIQRPSYPVNQMSNYQSTDSQPHYQQQNFSNNPNNIPSNFGNLNPNNNALVSSYLQTNSSPSLNINAFNSNHTQNNTSNHQYYNPFPNANQPNSFNDQSNIGDRSNSMQRNFIIPQNLKIKDESGTEIILNKGQMVFLIQQENHLILRTFSGKQVHIKGAFANFFAASSQTNKFDNIRHAQEPSARAPEVIDLSDED